MKSAASAPLIAVLLLATTACSPSVRTAAPAYAQAPSTVEVLYEVGGTSKGANVTVETGTGTSQKSVKIPMANEATGKIGITYSMKRGAFVYISAQNLGKMRQGANVTSDDFYGTVTCRITVDGQVISENSTNGKYGIASCQGTAS